MEPGKSASIGEGHHSSCVRFGYAQSDVHPIQFAFRAQDVSQSDLKIIADIGRIAINSRFMTQLLDPLGDNISGMCVRDGQVKLIAVNSSMSYGRQRFSLAHELYHLYFDDESGFNVCAKNFDSNSESEKRADQFASYFLAPAQCSGDWLRKGISRKTT